MAQGLSNAALAKELVLSPKTVEGHVRSVFTELHLEQGEREHRRVLAVLEFLRWQQYRSPVSTESRAIAWLGRRGPGGPRSRRPTALPCCWEL